MKSERKTTTLLKKVITIIITTILLIIQLLFFYIIFIRINDLKKEYIYIYNTIYIVVQTIGILMVLDIYKKDINVSYKLTWTICILLMPFIGTISFLLLGNGRNIPKGKNRKIESYILNKIPKNNLLEELYNSDKVAYKLCKMLHTTTRYAVFKNTKVDFFNDTLDKHIDMINELKKATKYVFLEYYIISKGYLLEELIEVLTDLGNNKVEIKIIYDDFGSKRRLRKKELKRLRSIPNLSIYAYEPLGINFNPAINYRDHRKMCIIDGKICYCGGDNLADEYIHIKEKYGFWRDNSVKLTGDSVKNYVVMFTTMWYMSSKETLDVNYYLEESNVINESFVFSFSDGPTNSYNPTYNLFLEMINQAVDKIYISTPYFIIDQTFIEAITRALISGVEVIILVPGIPDKKLVFMLTKSYYKEILKNGGKIYEYQRGFNHAKNVIVDDKYAYVGTTNIDYRSFFLHFECGNLIINDKEVLKISKDFLNAVEESKFISYSMWKKRGIVTKIFEFIFAVFAPLV